MIREAALAWKLTKGYHLAPWRSPYLRWRIETWTGIEAFKSHEHPLWTDQGKLAEKLGGHGGMDFILLYRLLQCVREGLPPDMDVYDAAAWSAVQPLSIKSVVQGSAPAQFPDFTRGKWKQRAISAIAMQA